jgi:murein L,D-transpeptidase YcbB/YkuD
MLVLTMLSGPVLGGGPGVRHGSLTERFYRQRNQALFWFGPGEGSTSLRGALLECLDSAAWLGLDSGRYRPSELRDLEEFGDSVRLAAADRRFTAAAFDYFGDVLRGGGLDSFFSYDAISPEHVAIDETALVDGLTRVRDGRGLKEWGRGLEPSAAAYLLFRDSLREVMADDRKREQLSMTLNIFRRIHHYHFDRFIVVNIPSARLSYFSADTLALSMKVVVGQVSKRTPRFAAWCTRIVLYPYWNIPGSITAKEMLPLLKKSPWAAGLINIEALDSRGKKVDMKKIPWSSYTAASLPYTLRQAPGCDNALGVIKFDLDDPFNVYMHDTNMKGAFASSWRYLSHGCIRLERPVELGLLLLGNKLDTAYLRQCLRGQQPVTIGLDKRIPVFVVYLTAGVGEEGGLAWYRDIYRLNDRSRVKK